MKKIKQIICFRCFLRKRLSFSCIKFCERYFEWGILRDIIRYIDWRELRVRYAEKEHLAAATLGKLSCAALQGAFTPSWTSRWLRQSLHSRLNGRGYRNAPAVMGPCFCLQLSTKSKALPLLLPPLKLIPFPITFIASYAINGIIQFRTNEIDVPIQRCNLTLAMQINIFFIIQQNRYKKRD